MQKTSYVFRKRAVIVVLVVWTSLTLFLGYSYLLKNGKRQADDEAQTIRKQLLKHVDIKGADPAVATVNDAAKLRGADQFYKRAQNGDKLIIWEEKAILYRPSTDRIVDFGIVVKPTLTPTPTIPVKPSSKPQKVTETPSI